jgi:hypothetical protein
VVSGGDLEFTIIVSMTMAAFLLPPGPRSQTMFPIGKIARLVVAVMAIVYSPSIASCQPSLEFEVDREKCKRWGIEVQDVVHVTMSPVCGPAFAALLARDPIASIADGQPI